MQTGGTNPKKKERLTNRSEKVMKKAVKNWEFARDVSTSGTTNRGELDVAEAMQNRAVKQGDRAKKIRAKADQYQMGGMMKKLNTKQYDKKVPSYKKFAKAAALKKATKKYQVGGVTNAGSDSIKAKAAAAAKAKAMKAMKTTGSKVGKMGTDTAKKYQMGGPSMYQGPAAAQQPTEDMAMDTNMNMNPMGQRQSSYKIGGMVNPNSNISKQTVPGSRGVKSGVNPKAAASKVARGTVGGTSTAPSKAIPKAQMGKQVGKKDYMKPSQIDSTLTKRDVKKIIRNISKNKKDIPKAQMGMGLKSNGVSRGKGNYMIDKPYERGVMGAGNSATKTTRRGDVKKTKTISGGGIYPGAKGSITKTKTVGSDKSAWLKNPSAPDGKVVKTKTKEISQNRANRMINRKSR